jgi:hypothetical protein
MANQKWDWFINMYDLGGNMPYSWWHCARRLVQASDTLMTFTSIDSRIKKPPFESEIPDSMGIIQMLRGMGVEALPKGLWLEHGGLLVKNGKYIGIMNKGQEHNLVLLASEVSKKASITFNKSEKYMMERLSTWIMLGRYPIHKNWDAMKPRAHSEGAYGPLNYWRFPKDELELNKLVKKIKANYKNDYGDS